MSEESSSEDRTEEPTSQRLQKAREDGDAARSIEVPAAAVVIAAAAFLVMWGSGLAADLKTLFAAGFTFDRKAIITVELMPAIFAEQIVAGFLAVMPLLLATAVAAVVASGLTGGYLFSMKAAGFCARLERWTSTP